MVNVSGRGRTDPKRRSNSHAPTCGYNEARRIRGIMTPYLSLHNLNADPLLRHTSERLIMKDEF
jgi:hypothetical protein